MILSLAIAAALSLAAATPAALSVRSADSLIRVEAGNKGFRVVDVRTPEEFASGHLAGASLVDFRSPDFAEEIGRLPRDAKILIYCRSGHRSGQALQRMQSMGFKDVHDIEGGILAWVAQGMKTGN